MKKNDVKQLGTLAWLYHQSYLGEINVRPKNLNALVETINKLRKKRGPDIKKVGKGNVELAEEYLYLEYISDALEKLGFLYFARDEIKNNIKDLHAGKYHVYNSIFDCKALLDTIAGLLNHHYKLGQRRAGIDLKRPEFRQKLANENSPLVREIDKFEVWVKAVSEWRDTLIHRHGILLLFITNNRYLMPIRPKRFVDIALFPEPTVDPIKFCEENIKCAKSIMEIIYGHIRKDLMKCLSN